jgi:hypothetical protein
MVIRLPTGVNQSNNNVQELSYQKQRGG